MIITVTLSISAWWLLAAGPICAQTKLVVVALLTWAVRVIAAYFCAAITSCCVHTVQVSTDKWPFTFWILVAVTLSLFAKFEAAEIDYSLIRNEESLASTSMITVELDGQLGAGWRKLWWESCATVPFRCINSICHGVVNNSHFCTYFPTSTEVSFPPSHNST